MIDEGYIKFDSRWRRTPPLTYPEIEELIQWRRPLYTADLIGHYVGHNIGYGNISMRLAESNNFVITATQTGHLSELDGQHFALVTGFDTDRNRLHSEGAAEPSSESMTHAAIYQLDQRIRAVVHVHSRKLWLRLKYSAATTSAGIAYGTPAMAQEFSRLFRDTDFAKTGIAVMAGHDEGLVSTGESLQQAAERILSLDAAFE